MLSEFLHEKEVEFYESLLTCFKWFSNWSEFVQVEEGPKVESPQENDFTEVAFEAAFRQTLTMSDREGSYCCNVPQGIQVMILSSENPPLKVADKMRQRQVSKAVKKLVDETAFFLVWNHADFSPEEGKPPISRAAFRRGIDYLCKRAKLNKTRMVEAARGQGLFTPNPCFRELVEALRENAARRARVQTSQLSDFLVPFGGTDFRSYISPQQSEIMGRFADGIMDLADVLLRSSFGAPVTFDGKPEMVLNISGLQNQLFFDDIFSATRRLSEHFALHLVADGWEQKTGMYSLSHFLYRRLKGVKSGLLSVRNEDDWRPVLERIAGMGETLGKLEVRALKTGEEWVIDAQRAKELGAALVRSQTLTSVSIGRLDVHNPEVLGPLARGLAGIPTLQRLRLRHVAYVFGPHLDERWALGDFLGDAAKSLTQLEMAGLDLTSLAVLDPLFEGLAKNESLESLSMSELAPVQEVSALAVVRLTEPNLGLRFLDLSTAHLQSAAAIAVLASNLAINKRLQALSITIVLEDSLPLLLLSSSLTKNKGLHLTFAVCFGEHATRQGYEALVDLKREHGDRVQLSCCSVQLSSQHDRPSAGAFEPLLDEATSGVLDRASLEGFIVSQAVPFGRPLLEQIMQLRDEWESLGLDKELESAQTLSHAAAPASKRRALGTRATP